MTADVGPDAKTRPRSAVARSSFVQSPWLIIAGVLLLSFNLRPTAVAVGPLLDPIKTGLTMSTPMVGFLTTLPVLCFAGFGALTPAVAAKVGMHRVMLSALVLVVAAQLIRATTSSGLIFLAATALGLSGMAACNVLMPSLVKLHFGHRIGLVTALYSTSLAIGLSSASMLTVPIAQTFGGWRWGLGSWAATAAVAIIPWLALVRHDRIASIRAAETNALAAPTLRLADVARTRLGWIMAAFFGAQSLQAYSIFGWLPSMYQDAGYSAAASGVYLGIATGFGIPLSFLLPAYAARKGQPVGLMIFIVSAGLAGYLGLLITPEHLPWLWAIFVAVGTSAFPVILTLIGLKARTSDGTAALSGFTQSVGYLLAAPGPFLVGLLFELTGSWVVPKIFLIVMLAPLLIMALLAIRPRFLEDEIAARSV